MGRLFLKAILKLGATVYRYALSIFIIRIFLRFVKGQTGIFSVLLS